MDGDPQPVRCDAEIVRTGDKLPGERDRFALEVVAEGEVAQHFEEGMVPLGVADLLEVVVLAAGANALLAGGGPACSRGSPVPRKMPLNCTIPALVNSRVGSSAGTSDEEGTSRCPWATKKSRKSRRICAGLHSGGI